MVKSGIKLILRTIATVAVSPLLILHALASYFTTADQSIESLSQLLALIPGRSGNYLRNAFYSFALKECDPTATICFGVQLSKTESTIGKNVYVGPGCMLGLVSLGDDVLLGPYVQIPSGPNTHGFLRLDLPIREQEGEPQRIKVGRDSWIGASSIIMADIAEGNVIAAGSVVTKPTAVATVNAGVPAKQIKTRS